MDTNRKYDLTEGGIIDKLLLVALPIVGTQLLLMSYNLVDMFLLGRVGKDAVAASGVAGMYVWLAEGFLLVGKMGAEIGVSQNLGRRDEAAAKKFAHNALFISLVLGVAYGVAALIFSKSMIGFFRVREEGVAASARHYLMIVAGAVPAVFVSGAVAGIFTGAGNSRAPFLMNCAGLVLNVALDVIFIFRLNMGVEGAAAATAISQTAAGVLSVAALSRKRDRPFERFDFFKRPDRAVAASIFRWTVPLCVVSFLFTFFTMFISKLAAGFGVGAIAVYRVGAQIESVCWLTGEGIATSVAAFVGQNYGAMKFDRIREGARKALIAWCSFGAAMTAIFIAFARSLFLFFLPDPLIADMGVSFLRILAVCEIFGCMEAISFGSMRGLGRTVPQFAVSIGSNALRVPIAYALSLSMGVDGIWMGVTITASIRGFLAYLCFRREMKNLR